MDDDMMQAAGEWYRGVLRAVQSSAAYVYGPDGDTWNLAAKFVQELARRGYMIDLEDKDAG